MIVEGYEVDEKGIARWLSEKNLRRVLIQAPDGLKRAALLLAEYLERLGVETFLSASHTWGGCDVALNEAETIGAEGIIHIGHHGPVWFNPPSTPPILFVPAHSTIDPLPALSSLLDELEKEGVDSVVILSTIQHAKWIPLMEQEVHRRKMHSTARRYDGISGLIVGCNYSSMPPGEREAIIVVAGGVFHAIGAAIWSGRTVWSLDPYTRSFRRVDPKTILHKRLYALSEALEATEFLLVVSTKPGQKRLEAALKAREALKRRGRTAKIAVFNEITREQLENMGRFDAYINTACPRLVIDDPEIFPGPSLNLGELKYLLKGSLDGYSLRDSLLLDLRFLEGA